MPIITATDLATNIYAEVLTQITRNDSTIVDKAINAAIQEAKMYLARFDLNQLFGMRGGAPGFQDEYLKSLVKDIACWHLLRLSNPGIDLVTYRTAYQDAIASLKNIMTGQAQPQGWNYANTDTLTAAKGDSINWSSNPKRENFY